MMGVRVVRGVFRIARHRHPGKPGPGGAPDYQIRARDLCVHAQIPIQKGSSA
jgi:hypothetical protein